MVYNLFQLLFTDFSRLLLFLVSFDQYFCALLLLTNFMLFETFHLIISLELRHLLGNFLVGLLMWIGQDIICFVYLLGSLECANLSHAFFLLPFRFHFVLNLFVQLILGEGVLNETVKCPIEVLFEVSDTPETISKTR